MRYVTTILRRVLRGLDTKNDKRRGPFDMGRSCAAPIDVEFALRAKAALDLRAADYDRRPCRAALLRVSPPRWWMYVTTAAVCRCAAVPLLCFTSRLTHHTPVAFVRLPCGVVLTGAIFYARPDGEQCARGLVHDEYCVGHL